MPSENPGSRSLWPVLTGLVALLAGAITLETVGRSREATGAVIEIRDQEDLTTGGEEADERPLLGKPINAEHAEARRLAQRGQTSLAIDKLTELANGAPQQAELLAEIGFLELVAGKSKDALVHLTQVHELAPENPWVALSMATAQRRLGETGKAEELYREALRLRPDYGAARIALGKMLRRSGRLDEALPILEKAAEHGGNEERARALTALGRAYLEKGRQADAKRVFEQAIERAPASVSIRLEIARSYTSVGGEKELAQAIELLRQAIRLAPALAALHGGMAAALEKKGDRSAAKEAFQRALELDPQYTYSRRRLLRLALSEDDFETAREQASALLSTDQSVPEHHFLAGLVEARAKRPEQARRHYREALNRANGHYPEALLNLGSLEKSLKNYTQAIEYYQQAIEQKPNYRAAKNNLGLAQLAAGNSAAAQHTFEALVDDEPNYATAWVNLAKVFAEQKNHLPAIEALERALQIRPGYSAATLNLAIALRKAGRPEDAVKIYDQLIATQPRYVSAWYNRGIALEAAKQRDNARSSYEQALELDPEHRLSRKRLARLETRAQRFERAESLYTEILDQDPSDEKSRRLRAFVRLEQGNKAGCRADAKAATAQNSKDTRARSLLEQCQ